MMLSNGKVAPIDKKPIDSEIVKALECCVSEMDCPNCPKKKDGVECVGNLLRDCFDLINRQNAKIDYQEAEINLLRDEGAKANVENVRLNDTLDAMVLEHKRLMKTVKAEAYKEFVERFIEVDGYNNHIFDDCASILIDKEYVKGRDEKSKEVRTTIDNLLKELVVIVNDTISII